MYSYGLCRYVHINRQNYKPQHALLYKYCRIDSRYNQLQWHHMSQHGHSAFQMTLCYQPPPQPRPHTTLTQHTREKVLTASCACVHVTSHASTSSMLSDLIAPPPSDVGGDEEEGRDPWDIRMRRPGKFSRGDVTDSQAPVSGVVAEELQLPADDTSV